MLELIPLSTIQNIASMRLRSHYNVRHVIGAQVMRVVDYAHFAQNKFKSLSITLWYNAWPLITFTYAFHKSSTKPHPCKNFSHYHNVHRESLLGFTCAWKCNMFGLIGHIWPPKRIIQYIYHTRKFSSLPVLHKKPTHMSTFLARIVLPYLDVSEEVLRHALQTPINTPTYK